MTPCACLPVQITNWSRRVYMGPARPSPPTEDRCMEPQHLTRPDDDGSVGAPHTGPAGGSTTAVSPEGPEVPVPAAALDAWPLPVGGDGPALPTDWPLPAAGSAPVAGEGA